MGTWKSILLHLDASAGEARMRAALRLAQAHGAQLEAVYAVTPAVMMYPYAFAGDGQGITMLEAYEAEQRERVHALFDRERAAMASVKAEWIVASGEPLGALARYAWGNDLLVLAQPDPDAPAPSGVPVDFVASVLIRTGKPGLLLPYIPLAETIGATPLIAWKSTAESARAVTAALPMLQRAKRVHVAVWEEDSADGTHAPPDIEAYLKHHGVSITVHRGGPPPAELGEMLLSLASDVQADLLVMGCYGHGRAREWVLGGVTRTVLRGATVPVLLTH
jgi:nucleotide-binding universal stress UspA family protein